MAPTVEHIEIEQKPQKPKLGGGGPGKIPHRRGYGGGGGDDGDHGRPDDFVSRKDRLRRYRIAMVVTVVSVTTLFLGLTSVYFIRQGKGPWDPAQHAFIHDWQPLALPYRLLFLNTLVLLLSSVTLEVGRRGLLRKWEFASMGIRPPKHQTELPWLIITALLGFGFLAGQLMVWNSFRAQGIYLASNPSSSFFYLLTGLHAVHLSGGLLVLLYTLFGSWLKMKFESQQIAVDVTGWYWHFMGVLWVYIFALLHFAK